MTREQSREIVERLNKAKNELIDALAIVEDSQNKQIARQIGSLCAKVEVLQNKVNRHSK